MDARSVKMKTGPICGLDRSAEGLQNPGNLAINKIDAR